MRPIFVLAPLLVFGCAEIAGITDLPDAGSSFEGSVSDGPPPTTVCTNGTSVLASALEDRTVRASSGRVYAEQGFEGLVSCTASAPCTSPGLLFNIPASSKLISYGLGSNLVYTLQAPADAGSVHSANFDGTSDQTLGQSLAHPAWIAVSGSRTFWVDDVTVSVLHCIGCGGSDMPWITGLNATYAAFADSKNVYVVADDGSNSSTDGIYGCSVNAACGASPRVVATGLSLNELNVASDGTNVFVARSDSQDVVAIDGAGTAKPLALNVDVVALAVDATKGELYFVTYAGLVAVVKTDGSAPPTVVSSCSTSFGDINSIALDAANAYVLMNNSPGTTIYAIPRP